MKASRRFTVRTVLPQALASLEELATKMKDFWAEFKATVPAEYRTHSMKMQLQRHIVGIPMIHYRNFTQGRKKDSFNLEDWHPDGDLFYYTLPLSTSCNLGGAEN